ncbi:MAG TPA: glycerol-3-phosphate 1-O-acyltransferase PlsY [Fervidobacterium sp.]|nr:acyl-phosphate glycerol 3-phosphate acyltransferase [Fervidobacterium sp.]HOM74267.1 glycerol-3-phosphate 1-O-acyltransferase PlsY [Fervidobacterium sp.]HOQ39775.1 glycerol-3-phosphate 1-O-acyltransferase PlsY [Fervidobacterium sp.]HPP17929.1 glycerol-3-phosphate 1-O-acyltransferase PlsY [Fervidobacterium sp.]HPT54292.1 glycerol-3-phosphate 1-O-acyltransferase PlsY [Fervidobacterium sp.]
MQVFWAAVVGYLIGSIPFSYIIPKVKGVDITKVGSGNVGGTNVLRTLGIAAGALSMFLDIIKAVAAVLIFKTFGEGPMVMAGAMAVIGHCFSPFLKFKGGKGVATTLGTFFAIFPQAGLFSLGIFITVVALTEYVSLASITGLIAGTIFALVFHKSYWVIFLALSLFSVLRHKENIKRLLNGNERKTDIVGYFLGWMDKIGKQGKSNKSSRK